MNALFADTFFWIAITNVQDLAHESAMALALSSPPTTILTTEEVLIEYLNYFAGWGPHFRRKALANAQNILSNPTVVVVSQSSASLAMGLGLYAARLDKGYSLTDCISMQTMRQQGLTDALTNDRHFEQEGFRALFRRGETSLEVGP
jgi:predicted nucleic acid-binding protein